MERLLCARCSVKNFTLKKLYATPEVIKQTTVQGGEGLPAAPSTCRKMNWTVWASGLPISGAAVT